MIRNKILKLNVLVLIGIMFSMSFVCSATFNAPNSDQSFNGGDSFVYSPPAQFYKPGTYTSFSQQHASDYWPALANKDTCEASTDFLMFVVPGSCSPSVVRSDLLEEQNVPVFCKVDILKLNPLIDVSTLKSVKFDGERGKYVSGISFHPNREAILSQKGLLDNPLINDVGYVVVLLKRIEKEKDMPESIRLNLTGVLRYDAEGIYGSGQSNYFLEDLSDDEWEDQFRESSFFKGKGYLRADSIDSEGARISIYSGKDEIETSFNLKKGETSGSYYMPGFYCKANVKVKLEDIIPGSDKAILEVDGERMQLEEGQKFLENECKVSDIHVDAVKKESSVRILCKGASKTLFARSLEGVNLEDKNIDNLIKDNFEKSREYAEDIEFQYGNVDDGNGNIWSARALYLLGMLARNIGLDKTSKDIFLNIISKYPDSAYSASAELALGGIGTDSLSQKGHEIRLIRIDSPEFDESSAEFEILPKDKHGINIGADAEGIEIIEGNTLRVKPNHEVLNENTGEKFVIRTLTEDIATIYYTSSQNQHLQLNLTRGESFTFVNINKERKQDTAVTLRLKNIYVKQVAKVSVLSEVRDSSKANFSLEIGIEKRAIQLSPQKTSEKIKNLNETIKEWEKVVSKLGDVVTVWKGGCLATSSVLVVKNFFNNLGGGATARQKVMPAWYEQCKKIAGNDDAEFNNCLRENNENIEKDINAYKKSIEDVNKKLTTIQKDNVYSGTESVDRDKAAQAYINDNFQNGFSTEIEIVGADGKVTKQPRTVDKSYLEEKKASLTDLRDLDLNNKILSSDSSDIAKERARKDNEAIIRRLDQRGSDSGELYSGEGYSWLAGSRTIYFENKPYNGLVNEVPIPNSYTGSDGKKYTGFYAAVENSKLGREGGYGDGKGGNLQRFTIKNQGDYKDSSSDRSVTLNMNTYKQTVESSEFSIFGLTHKDSQKLVADSIQAIETANQNYGKTRFSLFGQEVLVDKAASANEKRCQDFMSPQDCAILFNVCDPVVCPASRCDLGGSFRVSNVISSGIIGSIALCLPNIKEGIVVPVCLSGIHAGLESYVSILRSYRDCLQESLDSGRQMGICDEIHSIYICDFFWREMGPYLDVLFLRMIESSYGQGMKGGGEYLTVEDAWQNTQSTIDYMKNDYAANSYKAFNIRSMGDIGAGLCKNFVSAKYPNNADFFNNLLSPDSPTQFHAWFDEIEYSDVTVPATSQYSVFYYIWAGTDMGASYQVYLKSPATSAYVHVQEQVIVDTGYVPKGSEVSQKKDFTAPAGYKELCVRINGNDECGFGKVSTSFALNYATDKYYEEQLKNQNIKTEKECMSGSVSASSLINPNVQAGVESAINPALDKKGIVRICANDQPASNTAPQRWKAVGFCDDESVKCWLDTDSVKAVIQDKNIETGVLDSLTKDGVVVSDNIENQIISDTEAAGEIFKRAVDSINNIKIGFKEAKTIDDKNKFIDSVLETEREGKALDNINIKSIISDLTKVEEGAAKNNVKAEALFLKFKIYEEISNDLFIVKGYYAGGKLDIDSALYEATKYSGKAEEEKNTKFITQLLSDGVISESEYDSIIYENWDMVKGDYTTDRDAKGVLNLLYSKRFSFNEAGKSAETSSQAAPEKTSPVSSEPKPTPEIKDTSKCEIKLSRKNLESFSVSIINKEACKDWQKLKVMQKVKKNDGSFTNPKLIDLRTRSGNPDSIDINLENINIGDILTAEIYPSDLTKPLLASDSMTIV